MMTPEKMTCEELLEAFTDYKLNESEYEELFDKIQMAIDGFGEVLIKKAMQDDFRKSLMHRWCVAKMLVEDGILDRPKLKTKQ